MNHTIHCSEYLVVTVLVSSSLSVILKRFSVPLLALNTYEKFFGLVVNLWSRLHVYCYIIYLTSEKLVRRMKVLISHMTVATETALNVHLMHTSVRCYPYYLLCLALCSWLWFIPSSNVRFVARLLLQQRNNMRWRAVRQLTAWKLLT
jgi:hypothetical protein